MNTDEPLDPNQSEGLREDWVFVQRVNAKGMPYDDLEQRREVTLSANGAFVQKAWATEREFGCGHDARRPRGGRCGEEGCFRDSCAECFTRCTECQVGLCLFHVRYYQADASPRLPVCSHCLGVQQRRRFWRRFWTFLLSPFITLHETEK
jgi:hypothetical protein